MDDKYDLLIVAPSIRCGTRSAAKQYGLVHEAPEILPILDNAKGLATGLARWSFVHHEWITTHDAKVIGRFEKVILLMRNEKALMDSLYRRRLILENQYKGYFAYNKIPTMEDIEKFISDRVQELQEHCSEIIYTENLHYHIKG